MTASTTTLQTLTTLVVAAAPQDEDVVAGWTAFVLFILLILAVVVLGFSLTKRLKNVDRAAEAGLYDPSDPRKVREREARGLAAARRFHQDQAEREQARLDHDDRPGGQAGGQVDGQADGPEQRPGG